jgi:hypothetical protein
MLFDIVLGENVLSNQSTDRSFFVGQIPGVGDSGLDHSNDF